MSYELKYYFITDAEHVLANNVFFHIQSMAGHTCGVRLSICDRDSSLSQNRVVSHVALWDKHFKYIELDQARWPYLCMLLNTSFLSIYFLQPLIKNKYLSFQGITHVALAHFPTISA